MSETLPIIVVNWNGLSDTIECIDSILSSDYQYINIYLVDNNSSNDEGIHLNKKYGDHPKVKVILNDTNLGFGVAHNDVISNHILGIQFNYICLINNDSIVKSDCFTTAVDFAKREKVDVLSMKLIDYFDHNKMDNAGHKLLTNGEILPIGSQSSTDLYYKEFLHIGASGGACLYSKSCIDSIGLFDLALE